MVAGPSCVLIVSGLTAPPPTHQTEGHAGTAVHDGGHGAEAARLPCGAAPAEPRTAGGAGEPEPSTSDTPVANLVSVRLMVGPGQDRGSPCL